MKAEIVEVEKKFEPIEVKLVFETMQEVAGFIGFVKDPECYGDAVAPALDRLASQLRDKINKLQSVPQKGITPK